MSTVNQSPPPGTVAVAFSSDTGRYGSLFRNLNDLSLPEGSTKTFDTGPRIQILNSLVAEALKSATSYWVWFISDEHGFKPDIVEALLSRGRPIVAPVSLEDEAPYAPRAWTDETNQLGKFELGPVVGPASLIEVQGAYVTGMLIRRAVFEAMDPPWFKLSGEKSEDVFFCERARELGFEIVVDTSTRLSTYSLASVEPVHRGHRWELGVKVADDIDLTLPFKSR